MLVLMCSVGTDRLAIPVQSVIEVIPRVALQQPDERPDWLAGHFVYRGRPIPVITLTPLASASGNRLSNRIIIVSIAMDSHSQLVGVMVEGATTQQLPAEMVAAANGNEGLPSSWGKILLDETGMFHLVDLKSILRPEMLRMLFPMAEESPR